MDLLKECAHTRPFLLGAFFPMQGSFQSHLFETRPSVAGKFEGFAFKDSAMKFGARCHIS